MRNSTRITKPRVRQLIADRVPSEGDTDKEGATRPYILEAESFVFWTVKNMKRLQYISYADTFRGIKTICRVWTQSWSRLSWL